MGTRKAVLPLNHFGSQKINSANRIYQHKHLLLLLVSWLRKIHERKCMFPYTQLQGVGRGLNKEWGERSNSFLFVVREPFITNVKSQCESIRIMDGMENCSSLCYWGMILYTNARNFYFYYVRDITFFFPTFYTIFVITPIKCRREKSTFFAVSRRTWQ